MTSKRLDLEFCGLRFDAIETHEDGYDFAMRWGPDLMDEIYRLREVEEKAKAWSNAEKALDDLMATPPEQFDCPEDEWEAKQELVYQTRSALRAALERGGG